MTYDVVPGSLYLLMAVVLILGGIMTRREPLARTLRFAIGWSVVLGAGFILFTFRDNLDLVWQRVRSEATGEPIHQGRELRIPMAIDGHFWVTGDVNGVKVKFLVDSGATTTTIDRKSAEKAAVDFRRARKQLVRTGNGFVRVEAVPVRTLAIGPIVRQNLIIDIAGSSDGLNVLGMNFLSTLSRWGVEGRWLVMVP